MIIVDGDGIDAAKLEIEHVAGGVTIKAEWIHAANGFMPADYVYAIFTRKRALFVAWTIIKAALTFRRFK